MKLKPGTLLKKKDDYKLFLFNAQTGIDNRPMLDDELLIFLYQVNKQIVVLNGSGMISWIDKSGVECVKQVALKAYPEDERRNR